MWQVFGRNIGAVFYQYLSYLLFRVAFKPAAYQPAVPSPVIFSVSSCVDAYTKAAT